MNADIVTDRLCLRLMGSEVIDLLLNNQLVEAEKILGIAIPVEILSSPSSLHFTKLQLQNSSLYYPWSARAIVLNNTSQMVGLIRFHGLPQISQYPGIIGYAVEIGYRIFSDFRNKGYATEAVGAVMEWAQTCYGINHFMASVSPDNLASLRLISKYGFVKIAEVVDETDGLEFLHCRSIEPITKN